MSLTIQNISPSYAKRCLLSQPCGTFLVRYPTMNDKAISLIGIADQSRRDLPTEPYIILSIRVDETVYKYHVQHYRLAYNEQTMQENSRQLLEPYNRQRIRSKNGIFTVLKQECIAPYDDGRWFLNPKLLQGVDFNRLHNHGLNNKGISTAIWQNARQNDIKVFIKRFIKDSPKFEHELTLLKDLCHFSIVTLYGQYSDNSFSYLVFENAGVSLESHCPLKLPNKAKMRFIANVGFQVAYAMMYLEKKSIVHRDLTAGNVLIDSYGFIRVADFGHAFKKEAGKNSLERSQTAAGENRFQIPFLAPECLPDTNIRGASTKATPADIYKSFTSKSDVWSLGILLIQLMLPKPERLYPSLSEADIIQHVKGEREVHPQPAGCHIDMYLILKRCWAYETKDRLTFAEVRDKMYYLESIFRP